MLHIKRDPSGCLARLECDECECRSTAFLFGERMSQPVKVHDWLRKVCRSDEWGECASLDEAGHPYQIDLCPRHAKSLRRIL